MVEMKRKWAVIGAGRQGPAAAYDLAKFGAVDSIVLADFDKQQADGAMEKINALSDRKVVQSAQIDVQNREALRDFLGDFDLVIAAAPYRLNPLISHAAIDVGIHAVDMGIDSPDALNLHSRTDEAKSKGISVITDCGIAPGLINILAWKLLRENPKCTEIKLYCGGLPQSPEPPYFHKVGFSVDSLLGEYVDDVESLIHGEVVHSDPLADFEVLDFPSFGTLEAVTTSGGTGTAPYALVGKLERYEYKTLRYPGHWQRMIAMRDSGLWAEEIDDSGSSPRQRTLQEMELTMVDPNSKDVLVARACAVGPFVTKSYDLVDRMTPESNWTAMQRTTGFSTSIVALMAIEGELQAGCFGCESAVDPNDFFEKAKSRGFELVSND